MRENPISFQQLIDHALGALPEHEHTEVDRVLERRLDLAEQAALIREVLAEIGQGGLESAPQRSLLRSRALLAGESQQSIWKRWLAHVDALVATLVFDSHSTQAQLGYRGDDSGRSLAYETKQGRVDLEISEESSSHDSTLQIRGQIMPTGDEKIGAILLLDSDDQAIVKAAMPDDRGHFHLQCATGQYDLAIEVNEGAGVMIIRNIGA